MTHESGNLDNATSRNWIGLASIAATLAIGLPVVNQTAFAQAGKPEIIHDSEYYILEAQHGERWAVEDKELDAKLAELRKKFGTTPNIIHIMWDDNTPSRAAVMTGRLAVRNGMYNVGFPYESSR